MKQCHLKHLWQDSARPARRVAERWCYFDCPNTQREPLRCHIPLETEAKVLCNTYIHLFQSYFSICKILDLVYFFLDRLHIHILIPLLLLFIVDHLFIETPFI